jgi:hypothetical protein
MLRYASASIALLALSPFTTSAWAAGCASPTEAAALKTAVLQQELMVAALQCHETGAYNRFVNTYRPELQTSDAALKAFFVRRGGEHGEAGYDAFKTKAANLSALEQARDARAFCSDAHVLFQAALNYGGSLRSFVDARSGTADIANVCLESRPAPLLADAQPKPLAPAKPIAVAAAIAATAKTAQAALKAAPTPTPVAVVGVPAYSQPSIPYQPEDAAPPPPPAAQADNTARDMALRDREAARNEEESDAADAAPVTTEDDPPPPRPRYYRIRGRRYDTPYAYSYVPRGYPQGWQDSYYNNYSTPPSSYYYYRRGYYNW